MKYICDTTCQVRMPEGHIQIFYDGQVVEVPDDFEMPPHFRRIDQPLNFAEASREELMAAKWSYKALNEFCKETYQVEMPRGGKADMVNKFFDIKLRHIDKV